MSTGYGMESPSELNKTSGAEQETTTRLEIPFNPAAQDTGSIADDYPEAPSLLRVHVLYEDSPTEARATRLVQTLADNLKLDADFHVTSAIFDFLQTGGSLRSPGDEDDEADILLVSAHGRSELPDGLVTWVEDWLQHDFDGPRALVISLDPEAEGTIWASQFNARCQTGARAKSVDVFSHFGRHAGEDQQFSFEDLQYRSETKTALLDETLQWTRPSSHWGINE